MKNYNEKFQSEKCFTPNEVTYYLKKWLKDEIKECNKRVTSAESVLKLPDCLPENYTLSQREWEILSFRRDWLVLQLNLLKSF